MHADKQTWKTPVRSVHKVRSNQLGLQVARVLGFEFQRLVRKGLLPRRKPQTPADLETLLRDGVVVIHDFLLPETLSALREFYYSEIKNHEVPAVAGPKLFAPSVCSPRQDLKPPEIIVNAFVNNERLNSLIEAAVAHKQNILPLVRLHHYYINPDDVGIRESARTDELHYDVPLRNLRAFFFLEDCTTDNAAFEYAKGTHKLSLARLYFEYKDSIHQARGREGKPEAKVQPITDSMYKLLGSKPEPLVAKPNTMVVFDTMGLHRRGRFSQTGARQAILVDFRYLDSKANYAGYNRFLRAIGP